MKCFSFSTISLHLSLKQVWILWINCPNCWREHPRVHVPQTGQWYISISEDLTLSDWLLQWDKCSDLQLDGAVSLHLHWKPPLLFTLQNKPIWQSPLHLPISFSSSLSPSLFFTSTPSNPLHHSPYLSNPPAPYPPLSPHITLCFHPSLSLLPSFPTPPHHHHRYHSSTLSSTAWLQPGFRLRRSAAESGFLKPDGSPQWTSWRTFCSNVKKHK